MVPSHQLVAALSQLRGELSGSPLVVLGALALIGALGVLTVAGSRVAAVLLLGAAALWTLVNQRLEGPTLLVLSWNHGVSTADLLSVAAVGLALWRLVSAQVRRA